VFLFSAFSARSTKGSILSRVAAKQAFSPGFLSFGILPVRFGHIIFDMGVLEHWRGD
jgi:hypothetical protein